MSDVIAKIPDPKSLTAGKLSPAKVADGFTVVALGDLIHATPLASSGNAGLESVLNVVRGSDVAIANQEGAFFDTEEVVGPAWAQALLVGPSTIGAEIKSLGIDAVSLANNHSTDWGTAGLRATSNLLKAAGVVHAGAGDNRSSARKGATVFTPKGNISIVAAASTFGPNAGAQNEERGIAARPGISILRTRKVHYVPETTMNSLRKLTPTSAARDLIFGDETFRVTQGREKTVFEMNTHDHFEILESISKAKEASDGVAFVMHAHENVDGMDDREIAEPAGFLVDLFRDAVDAGADIVMGGGPHCLRGIEIYRGRPIFYGLGAFILKGKIMWSQDSHTDHYGPPPEHPIAELKSEALPGRYPEGWYDGIVASTTFHGGRARQVTLFPLDLGHEGAPERRGIPHFASPTRSQQILATLQDASKQFGTRIKITGSVGIIDL